MAMYPARVSIVCCTYNGIRFLNEAVESVLRQDFDDYELLLIDDGSTDGSRETAQSYERKFKGRIRLLEHPRNANRGLPASRNLGLRNAKGELVAFIDSDDVWLPSKLSEQVRIMDANPGLGMVCGAVNYWSSWSGGSDKHVVTGHKLDQCVDGIDALLSVYPLGYACAPCPSDVMVRSEIFENRRFEGHFVGPAQLYEDQTFFAKAYLAAPVFFSSSVWLDYRQHPDSLVASTIRAGLYPVVRRQFLNWFDQYVAAQDFEDKKLVQGAINKARWELDHPFTGRVLRRLRSLRNWRSAKLAIGK